MASLTVENYIKTIYQICIDQKDAPAGTGQIADILVVSPGTVTSMLKGLSDAGMVTYTPYSGVILTDAGQVLALRVLRRHRLIELFLTRTLSLSWDEVHAEAENMEHAVSDFLIDRIDAYLGHPENDPHGDPIPRADGTVPMFHGESLADLKVNDRFHLLRVFDQSQGFLRFLSEAGLELNTEGRVLTNSSEGGVICIEVNGRPTTLSHEAAKKLFVSTQSK